MGDVDYSERSLMRGVGEITAADNYSTDGSAIGKVSESRPWCSFASTPEAPHGVIPKFRVFTSGARDLLHFWRCGSKWTTIGESGQDLLQRYV